MLLVWGVSTLALVWLLAPGGATARLSRLAAADDNAGRRSGVRGSPVEDPRQRSLICIAACVVLGWLLGGWAVAAAGAPAGLTLSWWIGRLESPTAVRAREQVARDLPLAVDLLAACAAAGRPTEQALPLVSAAVGGALGDRLDVLTARLALGADPLTEWRRVGADPALAGLARAMVRSLESGAPLVDGLTRLAEDRRRERRTQSQLRARNVGVKAAAPLAACFLPAFMLIGVVPTVAGAFSNLVL